MDKCVQMLDKNYGALSQTVRETGEEPCHGSRELERRLRWREREESPKGRRTDIGVERKEKDERRWH
ncbi:hypothetical protein TNCV_5076061 [Trichonephila clavipes]|uniref:Uncharacterized protein n=1 Tax=Trichonephila clavipes TaxID=2585209 RepID=A0A8X6RU68_TRICX|nr:hypothetical protein TNCV_5076061 [Trichonephila clavipes]